MLDSSFCNLQNKKFMTLTFYHFTTRVRTIGYTCSLTNRLLCRRHLILFISGHGWLVHLFKVGDQRKVERI